MVLQRDEFLNYYIKGQILAIALFRDRNRFVEFQGMSKWLLRKKNEDKTIKLREIRDAAYLKANLEERKTKLSNENETFENENEQMTQFTIDGVVIKANLERLKEETGNITAAIESTEDDY